MDKSGNSESRLHNLGERVQGFQYPWVRSAISVGRDRASMVLPPRRSAPQSSDTAEVIFSESGSGTAAAERQG